MWREFQSISTWLRRFSPDTPVPSLLKIDSQSNSSGCDAVHRRPSTWVMFRGRAPSRQHSSFGPTSLSCALRNSVSDCEKGPLAGQIFIYLFLFLVCVNINLFRRKMWITDSHRKRAWTDNFSVVRSIEAFLVNGNSLSRVQSILKLCGNLIIGAYVLNK